MKANHAKQLSQTENDSFSSTAPSQYYFFCLTRAQTEHWRFWSAGSLVTESYISSGCVKDGGRSHVLINGGGISSVIPVSTPRLRLLWRTL
jgi:hypothetical protein